MADIVTLTGDWGKFEKAIDPKKWNAAFEKTATDGLKKLGFAFVKMAREAIENKEYAENAPSTIAAWYAGGSAAMNKRAKKRAKKEGISISESMAAGKTPLVDQGDLIRSINSKPDGMSLYMGANKRVDGRNVALELHEGTTRKEGGKTIVIPARPFISQPLESDAFGALFKEAITDALKEAFRG